MTLERDNVVKLSARDWIAIAGIATGICIAVLGAFMHHDRMLMQVVTEQQSINRRLDKIETKIENTRN